MGLGVVKGDYLDFSFTVLSCQLLQGFVIFTSRLQSKYTCKIFAYFVEMKKAVSVWWIKLWDIIYKAGIRTSAQDKRKLS